MIKVYIGLHVKYLLFLLYLNVTLNLVADFSRINQYQISWKSDRWEKIC